jgi:hypothetical protein
LKSGYGSIATEIDRSSVPTLRIDVIETMANAAVDIYLYVRHAACMTLESALAAEEATGGQNNKLD